MLYDNEHDGANGANQWIIYTPCPCGWHTIPKNRSWHLTPGATYENPTITPSVNETSNMPDMVGYRPEVPSRRCHYIITEGQIKYCDDCTHALAGQTHPLLQRP